MFSCVIYVYVKQCWTNAYHIQTGSKWLKYCIYKWHVSLSMTPISHHCHFSSLKQFLPHRYIILHNRNRLCSQKLQSPRMEHEKPPERNTTPEYKHPGSPNIEDSSLWRAATKSSNSKLKMELLLVNDEWGWKVNVRQLFCLWTMSEGERWMWDNGFRCLKLGKPPPWKCSIN